MNALTFLTITSGDNQLLPLELSSADKALLRPLLEAGSGPVPTRPGYTCRITAIDGGAVFSIARGPLILSYCGVTWQADAAHEIWLNLEQAHLASYQAVVSALGFATPDSWLGSPREPTNLPWLAVSLQPGLLRDPLAGKWLAGFERDVALALLLS